MTSTAGLRRPAPVGVPGSEAGRRGRVTGLDGLRGLAALFVVVHHCYLLAFPGYPVATGPWWTGWMIYGHLAVVVFIVLSGYSLALAPARHGWCIGSLRRYAHRRAWRILSAYWPALVLSLLVAAFVVPQPGEGSPTLRSVVVYGLLLHDVVDAPSPNGAMWSIPVEAQLYIVLPLLLLLVRRVGPWSMTAVVAVPVLAIGTLRDAVPLLDLFTRFTPQLAVGFAAGVAGVALTVGSTGRRSRHGSGRRHPPLHWLAALSCLPLLVLMGIAGSVWSIEHYFWIDLAVLPGVVLLLVSLGRGEAPLLARALDLRPIRSLGEFSYSLYLVHAPIVVMIGALVVHPRLGTGADALAAMLVLGVGASLVGGRLFAACFDLPFQRHTTWPSLRSAMAARLRSRFGRARDSTAE